MDTGHGQHNGIIFSPFQFVEPGGHIAPDIPENQFRQHPADFPDPPGTPGPHHGARFQFPFLQQHQGIPGIRLWRRPGDHQPGRQLVGKILGTVDGDIRFAAEQFPFDFTDEDPPAADFHQSMDPVPVPGRGDGPDFRLHPRFLQEPAYNMGLCQGKAAAPGGHNQFFHLISLPWVPASDRPGRPGHKGPNPAAPYSGTRSPAAVPVRCLRYSGAPD